MTNGEKIKQIFPGAEISIVKSNYGRTKVAVDWKFEQIPSYYNLFYEEWWNAEYKEPTTKNEAKYCDRNICLKNEYNNVGCEDCEVTKSQEPTTKNNLGVDAISRADVLQILLDYDYANENALVLKDIKALPSVTPQLSSELEKNSKKLEKDFGELDCISRADAIDSIRQLYLDLATQKAVIDLLKILPSVTPQEPKWIPVSEKYEHHIDHTDCIWYGNDSGCPVTCSQYRDGWNDAMDYIFKNGDGYRPYRRNENG